MSQKDPTERPHLNFFRATPECLLSRPPLCSSLQNLESSFMLIALGRFPHALVTCASSIEGAMKAVLNISPQKFINAAELYAEARAAYCGLESFDECDLEHLRFTRNRIVHYGFSTKDDEGAAEILLNTGFPFVRACYLKFFDFDLLDGLVVEYAQQLDIALNTFQRIERTRGAASSLCFTAFSHLIRWSLRESLMAHWERDSIAQGERRGVAVESSERRKGELESILGATWTFDCPICDDVDTLVCELDEAQLERKTVTLIRGACASCDLVVREMPFLADALVGTQIETKRMDILREYGLLGNTG